MKTTGQTRDTAQPSLTGVGQEFDIYSDLGDPGDLGQMNLDGLKLDEILQLTGYIVKKKSL